MTRQLCDDTRACGGGHLSLVPRREPTRLGFRHHRDDKQGFARHGINEYCLPDRRYVQVHRLISRRICPGRVPIRRVHEVRYFYVKSPASSSIKLRTRLSYRRLKHWPTTVEFVFRDVFRRGNKIPANLIYFRIRTERSQDKRTR